MADVVLQTLLGMKAGNRPCRGTALTGARQESQHGARQNGILDSEQSAVYLHVEEVVVLSDGTMGPRFCDPSVGQGGRETGPYTRP